MTTIAIRNGVMAADSQVSCGERFEGLTTKIHALPCGAVLGFSGNLDFEEKVLAYVYEWPSFPPEKPTLGDAKFACMILECDGKVTSFNQSMAMCSFSADYFAIGSGVDFAYGAMAFGATAAEAVYAAIKHDVYSCGPIVEMRPSKRAA